MQNDVPVVDDHEGTNGEGNVGVKSEGQVVYERKFQRIQKKKYNGSDERQINMAGVLLFPLRYGRRYCQ